VVGTEVRQETKEKRVVVRSEAVLMNHFFDQYLLYRLYAKGDAQAFGRLYDRYVTSIYRFVYVKISAKETAEDITSETFLRCWQHIQSRRRIQNLRAFLYQIARNLVIDHYRRMASQPEAVTATVTFSEDGASSGIEAEWSDGNRGRVLMEARTDVALLMQQIARLKEDYQDVLQLRLIDGLGFGDIADILGKTPGNVRVIYHRAMKSLEALHSPHDPA
jgi:RNA polymerase sigma-70 factor (ECF subfamily)